MIRICWWAWEILGELDDLAGKLDDLFGELEWLGHNCSGHKWYRTEMTLLGLFREGFNLNTRKNTKFKGDRFEQQPRPIDWGS